MDKGNSFLDLPEFLIMSEYPSRMSKRPTLRRFPSNKNIPTSPGSYYWSEYKSFVNVVERRGKLYVTPPIRGGVEIRVTERIAGVFTKAAGK